MTRQDAMKILAILKSAYPNSYKTMDQETASATINIWSTQFISMPYEIVFVAIQKMISTNTFPPSIKEVKDKIRELYYEAEEIIRKHKQATEGVSFYDNDPDPIKIGDPVDERTLAFAHLIIKHCADWRTKERLELSIEDIISGHSKLLSSPNGDNLKLN